MTFRVVQEDSANRNWRLNAIVESGTGGRRVSLGLPAPASRFTWKPTVCSRSSSSVRYKRIPLANSQHRGLD
jgi:hypothetical protein